MNIFSQLPKENLALISLASGFSLRDAYTGLATGSEAARGGVWKRLPQHPVPPMCPISDNANLILLGAWLTSDWLYPSPMTSQPPSHKKLGILSCKHLLLSYFPHPSHPFRIHSSLLCRPALQWTPTVSDLREFLCYLFSQGNSSASWAL